MLTINGDLDSTILVTGVFYELAFQATDLLLPIWQPNEYYLRYGKVDLEGEKCFLLLFDEFGEKVVFFDTTITYTAASESNLWPNTYLKYSMFDENDSDSYQSLAFLGDQGDIYYLGYIDCPLFARKQKKADKPLKGRHKNDDKDWYFGRINDNFLVQVYVRFEFTNGSTDTKDGSSKLTSMQFTTCVDKELMKTYGFIRTNGHKLVLFKKLQVAHVKQVFGNIFEALNTLYRSMDGTRVIGDDGCYKYLTVGDLKTLQHNTRINNNVIALWMCLLWFAAPKDVIVFFPEFYTFLRSSSSASIAKYEEIDIAIFFNTKCVQ
eukprot:jgi/Psemu1/26688/gm1.26688_g